jgi:phosphate-selective porin
MRHDSGLEVRALHYDNRADRRDYKASISDWAWKTRFDSIGLRYDGPAGFALIAQYLDGETYASSDLRNEWYFKTGFVMLAREFGAHRFAVRYDDFQVDPIDLPGSFWSSDKGNAWTLGWTWKVRQHVELAGEWMQVDSTNGNRTLYGDSVKAKERILQLALRLSL